jgi:hypothetical protein
LDDALYLPRSDGFDATQFTRGPWDPGFQHAGPPSALLAREAERVSGLHPGQFARITLDILRPVPIGHLHVESRVLRPGRRVEQVEALLTAEGETLMRLTAWRVRDEAMRLPAGLGAPDPPPPGPEELPEAAPGSVFGDAVGYHRALEWRAVHGSFEEAGPAAVWTRMRVALVAGEAPTPLQHLLVMADAASGVSAALDWSTYAFPKVDFGVHLERAPEGEWMAMDAVTRPGPHGMGQCTGVLSDRRGRLGISTQSLLIAER